MEISASGDNNISDSDRIAMIEEQELEAPQGHLPNEVYCEFLALYMLHDELNNSKLLWKRIPAKCKSESPELKALWEICKAFLKRDFAGVFQQCNAFSWSDVIQKIVDKILKKQKESCLNLMCKAYKTITVESAATLLGCSVQEFIELAVQRSWVVSEDKKTISPSHPKKQDGRPINNEAHLEKLTQYISFLET